jgi:hypothetical protein
MEELHTDSIDGGHEASYGARSRARERAYSNNTCQTLTLTCPYVYRRNTPAESTKINEKRISILIM